MRRTLRVFVFAALLGGFHGESPSQTCEDFGDTAWGYRASQLSGEWYCNTPYMTQCQYMCICDENGEQICCTSDGLGYGDC